MDALGRGGGGDEDQKNERKLLETQNTGIVEGLETKISFIKYRKSRLKKETIAKLAAGNISFYNLPPFAEIFQLN